MGFSLTSLGEGPDNAHGPLRRRGSRRFRSAGTVCIMRRARSPSGPAQSGIEMGQELAPRHPLLFLDPLLHGGEGVGHRGQRRAIHAEGVELHAAVAGIEPLFDRAVREQVQDQVGEHLVHVLEMEVDPLGHHAHRPVKVPDEAVPEVRHARARPAASASISRSATSKIAAKLSLMMSISAYSRPGIASQWQPAYARSRASSSGKPLRANPATVLSTPRNFGTPVRSSNRISTPRRSRRGSDSSADAHAHVGRNVEPVGRFENQERDGTGHVLARGVGAAELDVGRVAQQQAGDVEDGLLVGQAAGPHVGS